MEIKEFRMIKLSISQDALDSFRSAPTPFPDIIKFIDTSEYTTSEVANAIGIAPQKIYSYRSNIRKKERIKISDKVEPSNSKKGRERYSAEEKFRLVQDFEKITTDNERVHFHREYGLYSSDISRWKEAIYKSALETLGKKKNKETRLTQEKIKTLEIEIQRKDRENQKLKAIVDLQKKVSDLLGIK